MIVLKKQSNNMKLCLISHTLNNILQVFNGCPLHIHCTASWIHPETRDQHILIGAEEGIYTLNLNELHEATMEQLLPTRTIWMFVIKDILMTVSGNLYFIFKTYFFYSYNYIKIFFESILIYTN